MSQWFEPKQVLTLDTHLRILLTKDMVVVILPLLV